MANKNAQIIQLSTELDKTIALVVHARESLTNELDSEWAQKKLSVDDKFLKKLKELTASFNSLTESKIRLDKATKAVERDLTPEEERDAVVGYLMDMNPWEMSQLCKKARAQRDGEPYVYVAQPVQGKAVVDE